MSIAELKATADKLTARERAWLKNYLSAKERANDPAWKTEMSRRLKRMRTEAGVADSDYRRRHRTSSKRVTAAAQ